VAPAPKDTRPPVIAAAAYFAIVIALWLPFNLHSGFPYETGFTYTSEISTWWNGFLHAADWMRIYTSFFYQIGYLIGELFAPGSWVPYQIVYAVLWWARAFLVFLIGRRLVPGQDLFWYLAGALTLVHSSDLTIGWVGQMNQFGFIIWMLAAFYMLVLAFEQTVRWRMGACLLCAAIFEHLSLWSYESQILLILAAPILLLGLPATKRAWMARAAVWYAVPAIYIAVSLVRYSRSAGHSYQESVLRKTWSVGTIASDWLFNIWASLHFWAWPGPQQTKAPVNQLEAYAALATLAFLAGIALFARSRLSPSRYRWFTTLLAGVLLLALSFPVYLVLNSARSLWRTQIVSGLGASITFAAIIALLASSFTKQRLQLILIATLGGVIVAFGSYSAIKKAAYHRWVWERHRSAVAGILHVAPRLKPGTLVVLTNVPRDPSLDPFQGDNTWFDFALRLAYPNTSVSGLFYYDDERPADHAVARLAGAGVGSLLVIHYDGPGAVSIARETPQFLAIDADRARSYNPEARIEGGGPSPRAVRRYF
jgi:hypothetical protein